MVSTAYKFGHLDSSGNEVPFHYPNCWAVESTKGPPRLVIAPANGHIALMKQLAGAIKEPQFLLYVLVVPRSAVPAGRYQSPAPVPPDELEAFLAQFQAFLEKDGRHHFWIGTADHSALLVYDNHNVLYAYGPSDPFEKILRENGLSRSEQIRFPVPHVHRYNVEFDAEADQLLNYWPWKFFPLQETDDQ